MAVDIDITPRPDGAYRLALWTVGPSIERKYPRIEALNAHIVITPRAGSEARLLRANRDSHSSMAWVGRYSQRGLGAIAFEDARIKLDGSRWDQRLEWIAPMVVSGQVPSHQLLAVWPLGTRAQVTFKSQPPAWQPIQMMRLYSKFLTRPTVVAGDFDNNPVFHKNDPNWDMLELVARLQAVGLTSVYHEFFELDHGDPRELPTRFKNEPDLGRVGQHTDYMFVPHAWVADIVDVQIGAPDVWAKSGGVQEHLPIVVDFDAEKLHATNRRLRKNK